VNVYVNKPSWDIGFSQPLRLPISSIYSRHEWKYGWLLIDLGVDIWEYLRLLAPGCNVLFWVLNIKMMSDTVVCVCVYSHCAFARSSSIPSCLSSVICQLALSSSIPQPVLVVVVTLISSIVTVIWVKLELSNSKSLTATVLWICYFIHGLCDRKFSHIFWPIMMLSLLDSLWTLNVCSRRCLCGGL
jgi:hypothetical protein